MRFEKANQSVVGAGTYLKDKRRLADVPRKNELKESECEEGAAQGTWNEARQPGWQIEGGSRSFDFYSKWQLVGKPGHFFPLGPP